jgi:hypothetical protein
MLEKEAKSGVIDLPEDEPEVIRLLIQYLYEAEYNPVLPTGVQGEISVATPPRDAGYHYDFPHSCRGANRVVNNTVLSVSCTKRTVCPHHACGAACRFDCHYFSCEICTAPSSLPPSLPLPAGTAEDLLLHAKMYEVADKYDIPDLKDLAKAKFEASCRHFWDTPSFAIAARHAFSTTVEDDRGLRDIVSATISEHLELMHDLEVGAVMDEFNGLALGILRATIGEQGRKLSHVRNSGR